MNQPNKFIISGGGTGGHIFPAIAIANALKAKVENAEILFIGAEGRMEMEKVPAAGYKIIGLPIRGFDRTNMLRNVKTLFLLAKSMYKAKKIVKAFEPNAVIGVGGYASGPTLKVASQLGIPVIVQEQNSFAGVTNKLLSDKAACFCVAYEGMERFFPKEKIILTGNPIRQDLQLDPARKEEAYRFFNLDPAKKTLLLIGGSLGARTLNQSLLAHLETLAQSGIQVIWQAGKIYIENLRKESASSITKDIILTDFVARMDYAYAIADLVISRAGASSISELCLLGKPSILVPSPNVAEDHQTHNAMALVHKDAAVMIKDGDAKEQLVPAALKLIEDNQQLSLLAANCLKLAEKDSAARIADEILKRAKIN
ncbi:undecaprenyldiphospho-muramoylpentapeptide beta-N-acetylglucosaminyltransferase [Paludibacter sp.]|uniref:undecaprenyldiphospho-muramoylpentapeptide beta-N-acetylglucosaminyltransferase n=1 Tax=Paludibacter sp. TaxID=1898105 RepID=UPI001354B7AE|nr:undecaprenyldiphospho-muramoylpentapeptide beta-N-acetylglucosaminyltransferase [Paludibacter sp.]MTK52085.1 undecaprenyldiphospho-muramoylpentapeptide beta-N-acetylglucosaminyltransferase [Paludibacter sp.]